MKYLITPLLLVSFLAAQTAAKKPIPACRESKDSAQLKQMLIADLERERSRTAELEKRLQEAEAAKVEAQAKQAAAEAALQQIRVAGIAVVNYTEALQTEYKKTIDAHNALVEKYNSMLSQANNIISQQNARLAKQQRINNALAIYSLMPRYTPIQPPPLPKTSINCISNSLGSTTYTNCN